MTDNSVHNVEHEDIVIEKTAIVEEGSDTEIQVRFEVASKPLDLTKVNRVARRLLEGQAKKYREKYRDMVGPNNERPSIIIRMARLMDKKIDIVLEYPESMKSAVKGHERADRIS